MSNIFVGGIDVVAVNGAVAFVVVAANIVVVAVLVLLTLSQFLFLLLLPLLFCFAPDAVIEVSAAVVFMPLLLLMY